jgi:hypothetical protein
MKHEQKFWTWLLALAGAVALTTAIPSTRAESAAVTIRERPATITTYHYVYYPEAEVYFVPEQKVYFFSESGTWRSAPSPPPEITLGASVNLDLDKPEPWKTHEVIVKKYGGKHHTTIIKEKVREKGTEEKIREKEAD